jgi:putative ABC transport system substrate-binding protein
VTRLRHSGARAQRGSPESTTPAAEHGFRARGLAPAPRNDRSRRSFVALLAGAAASAAWPLTAGAQQAKLPTIGFLGAGTPSSHGQWAAAFVQRLHELGWIEGRTVAIEYRWAEGRRERAAEIAAEFVRLKVDVIATSGTALIIAAKQATSTIPIIFAAAGDPVGTGLVASLARPDGNVTGLSIQATDVAPKRLQLLREVVPELRRLAIIGNVDSPIAVLEMNEVESTARTIGVDFVLAEVRRAEDIAPGFEALKDRADALYVANDPLIDANRTRIITLALAARLPTMYGNRAHVDAGGLLSYATNFADLFRRAGDYVDKILRGAKPADLPVEQPTKFDLVVNLTTAKALGLKIPEAFLLRADEVIE